MATRRQWHLSAISAIVGAALLAACGGGDSGPTTTRVVVFGDSLSDMGAYTPATQIPLGQAAGVPPFFGGKFTTNTHTGYTAASNTSTSNTWGEWVAARLGIAITPHEVGFGPQSVKCPAAANPAHNLRVISSALLDGSLPIRCSSDARSSPSTNSGSSRSGTNS